MKKKHNYTFLGRLPSRKNPGSYLYCLYFLKYEDYGESGHSYLQRYPEPMQYFETKEEAEFMIAIRGLDVYRFSKYAIRHAIPFSEIKKDDVRV